MSADPPPAGQNQPIIALSTMWSQGRFPRDDADGDDMDRFAEAAARLGYSHTEISYVIPPDGVEQLLGTNHVAVSALHSPTPRVKTANGRWSETLNLASLDPDERALAVRHACATIDHATRAGARYIVVHLGAIDGGVFDEEHQLRRLHEKGFQESEQVQRLRRQAIVKRREGARRHFPEAGRSLAEIADHAARAGVAVGLENRFRYHEFPSIDEMHELVADYPPHVAGFWLDVGHAEVMDRIGFTEKRRWLAGLSDRCLGVHLHDVDGLTDHRAPGRGDVRWDYIAAGLPRGIPRVFEIDQRVPEDQVAAAIPFLRGQGVL
jgi:sugar phosphate isomerase/epimerase